MLPLHCMLKVLLFALPVTLTGVRCVSIPAPASSDDAGSGIPDASLPGCEDVDNDGYRPQGCSENLPADCQEGNALVHPGAFDDCLTPADEDCVGGNPDCSAIIQPITVETEDADTRITTVAGVTTFDGNQGFSITSITSNATGGGNLLHQGPNPEKYIGSHLFLSNVFSYAPQSAQVSALAGGRAVHQYRVVWNSVRQMGTGTEELSGTSTYTLFPDGRIHRSEDLSPTGDATLFTTYIALNPGQFTHRLDPNPANLNVPLPLQTNLTDGQLAEPSTFTTAAADGRGCAYHTSTNLALSYAWSAYDRQKNVRIRMPQSILDSGHQFAMVIDWEFPGMEGTVSPGRYRGAFLLQHGLASTDGLPCSDFGSDIGGFFNPPPLNSQALVTDTEGDPDGDGYVEDGGYYELNAEGGKTIDVNFELGGSLPRSYAMHINEVPASFDPVLFLGNSTAPLSHSLDYLMQREEDGSMWVFINRPIEVGTPLRIVFP